MMQLSAKPESEIEIERKLMNISEKIMHFKGVESSDIDRKIVDCLLNKIDVKPTGERTASIRFYINSGEEKSLLYDRDLLSCSGNIFKKMIEAQERQMAGK